MNKIIVIPARFASTRLPGKPLREICGKSIIFMVYEKAMLSRLKDEVIIATDDERIRNAGNDFGAEVAMTSPDCRSGTDRCREAIQGKDADIIVNLQGDEPFIKPDMIDMLFEAMLKENLDMATLCTPIANEEEYSNPNTVKVVLDKSGFALYFSRSPIPYIRNVVETNEHRTSDVELRSNLQPTTHNIKTVHRPDHLCAGAKVHNASRFTLHTSRLAYKHIGEREK